MLKTHGHLLNERFLPPTVDMASQRIRTTTFGSAKICDHRFFNQGRSEVDWALPRAPPHPPSLSAPRRRLDGRPRARTRLYSPRQPFHFRISPAEPQWFRFCIDSGSFRFRIGPPAVAASRGVGGRGALLVQPVQWAPFEDGVSSGGARAWRYPGR